MVMLNHSHVLPSSTDMIQGVSEHREVALKIYADV
jgi:hypothetical protein